MKAFTKPACGECPHTVLGNSLRGVTDLEVNGKRQDYHPCHMNTHHVCTGAVQRLALIQAGAPVTGDLVKFKHKVQVDV